MLHLKERISGITDNHLICLAYNIAEQFVVEIRT